MTATYRTGQSTSSHRTITVDQYALAEALQDTAAILNSTLNLDEVLERILQNIGRVVPHEAVNIMILDHDVVRVVKSHGYERWDLGEAIDTLVQPISKMPGLQQMLQSGEPMLVAKIQHASVEGIWRPNGTFHSYLGAPILIDGHTIGFINLNSSEEGFFDELDAHYLMLFANHAAIAIRNARLHDEARERNRQLAALNEITRISASAQNMGQLLKEMADIAVSITNAMRCYVTFWDSDRHHVAPAAASGDLHKSFCRVKFVPGEPTLTQAVVNSSEVLIFRGWDDLPYTEERVKKLRPFYDNETILVTALRVGGQALGAMSLVFEKEHRFSDSEIEWVQQAAELTALVLGRAQAYNQMESEVRERTARLSVSNRLLRKQISERRHAELAEREQRNLAEALRDTAASLNSTLNLDEVLDEILANVGRVMAHDSANIMLIEQGTASMVRARGYEERGARDALLSIYFPANSLFDMRQLIESGEPVCYCDTHDHPEWADVPESKWVRSYIGAPIRMEGTVIGFLNLDSATPNFFCPNHLERLKVFTDQAAIAIKNARLYEQARRLAALEERERLARDLHDAVSQTLWSASLIADVLPTIWEQDPQEGMRSLEQLQELTRVARDEMRSLLLDLKPDALSQMALRDLLAQLVKTLGGRSGIDIVFISDGNTSLPASVQVTLYRIAQEALNNVVKHSQATRANVQLSLQSNEVELSISDNGRGFDQSQRRTGHLGQRIMQERAKSIGATMKIESGPQGTHIQAHWRQGSLHR